MGLPAEGSPVRAADFKFKRVRHDVPWVKLPGLVLLLLLPLIIYVFAILAASVIAISGALLLRPLAPGVPRRCPRVSIVVPVKDEADTLRESLSSLVALDYPDKEIIAVCGKSSDGTEMILTQFEGMVLNVVESSRPRGWLGKSWACHEGYLRSSGDMLLFTDGDVIHSKDSLASALAFAEASGADFISAWPRASTRAFSERLMLPVGMFLLSVAFESVVSARTSSRERGIKAANGQYILLSRAAYERIGGHEFVRSRIIEDGALGARAVDSGLNVINVDGDGLLKVKPYSSFREVWAFIQKAGAGFTGSLRSLLLAVAFMIIYFTSPFLVLAVGLVIGSMPILAAALIAVALLLGTSVFFFRKHSWGRYFFLAPCSAVMIAIGLVSGFRKFGRNGVVWKDIPYTRDELTALS